MLKDYPVRQVVLPNGETLAYREAGSGDRTLVLIHGNMSSSVHYDLLMERLESQYKLYAVDLRGFGDSSYIHPISSLRDFADDIRAWVEIVGIERFAVAGWSTGGGAALELAADLCERVEKVVLIESVGVKGYPMFKKDVAGQPILTERITTREQVAQDPVQVLPLVHAYATSNKFILKAIWNAAIYNHHQPEPDRYERYLNAMLQQRNLVDVDYALVMFNMTDESNGVTPGSGRLEQVTCPVLVIQGERDIVVPPSMGQEIAQELGDRAQLRMMKESGHSPITDDLDGLVRMISDFLG